MSASRPHAGAVAGVWLFVAAVFAAAFLIFLVQPMVGKRILPWFGGAPAVWTLCLAFYQFTLFLGYAYAHLLIRYAQPSLQLAVHAAVVVAALLTLPVLPSDAWKPQGPGEPPVLILAMLLANVALPFMALASTGPLVQTWFARSHPGRSPYPLYAVSNVGSLLALLAYPLWLEPRLPLSQTGTLWSIAFAPTALAVLGCAAVARRADRSISDGADGQATAGEAPTAASFLRWLLLSATAVVMLMGVTNKLCLDVASVPFLWILPLATYLVTFILCFASERTYRRAPYALLFAIGIGLTATRELWISELDPSAQELVHSVGFLIASFCGLLFASCMMMHGELYRLRPPVRSLTAFYLCVSAGGALGGLFVGLVAPVVFADYYEFELGLALVGLLALAAWATDPGSGLRARGGRWGLPIVAITAVFVLGFAAWQTLRPNPLVVHQQRGFFGVLKVTQLARSGRTSAGCCTEARCTECSSPGIRPSPRRTSGVRRRSVWHSTRAGPPRRPESV